MDNFVIPSIDRPTNDGHSEYLRKSIQSFSDITGIPITFFNKDNEIVEEFLSDSKICSLFNNYRKADSSCRMNLSSSGQFTARLGEPYIYMCKAGLTNIAMALIVEGEFSGYFIAGPIIMGELRSSTVNNFQLLNHLDDSATQAAKMFSANMQVYAPNQVSEIALLLYNTVITAVSGNNDYDLLRNQYSRQNRINEDIRKYKNENASFGYPYDLEQTLIQDVLAGATEEARRDVLALLNDFSILEAGNLEAIKAKCLWLLAIVIRLTNKQSTNLDEIFDTDLDVISRISDTTTFDELSDTLEYLIEIITGNMISSVYSGHSQIISKSLQYINSNYNHRVTLSMIEEELHVNSSYFSTLFKNEMGISFTQYINHLRVEKACELLVTTNMSIIDILMTIGFDDQSYFTKVFKKETGMTPRQYRTQNTK